MTTMMMMCNDLIALKSWLHDQYAALGEFLEKLIPDAWRKERLLTFREKEEGGRERVTNDIEEQMTCYDWGW